MALPNFRLTRDELNGSLSRTASLGNITAPSNPHPRDNSPNPIEFIDKTANHLQLTPEERNDIHVSRQWNRDLPVGEQLWRVLMHASIINLTKRTEATNETYKEVIKKLEDVKKFLEVQERITDTHKEHIRTVCRTQIFQPWRMDFDISHDVYDELEKYKETNGFANLCEARHSKALKKEVDKIAGTIRGQFRMEFKNAADGVRMSLSAFAQKVAENFIPLGTSTKLTKKHLFWLAVIRELARRNPEWLRVTDDQENQSSQNDLPLSTATERPPPLKKPRKAGRVKFYESWWGRVGFWFAQKVKEWGSDLTQGEWSRFIIHCIEKERQLCPDDTMPLIPDLGPQGGAFSRGIGGSLLSEFHDTGVRLPIATSDPSPRVRNTESPLPSLHNENIPHWDASASSSLPSSDLVQSPLPAQPRYLGPFMGTQPLSTYAFNPDVPRNLPTYPGDTLSHIPSTPEPLFRPSSRPGLMNLHNIMRQ